MKENEEYRPHANTVFWLMREKDHTMKSAISIIAKKYNLVKSRLEKELREILPSDFLANRKRAAQNNFVPKMMFNECKPKKKAR